MITEGTTGADFDQLGEIIPPGRSVEPLRCFVLGLEITTLLGGMAAWPVLWRGLIRAPMKATLIGSRTGTRQESDEAPETRLF